MRAGQPADLPALLALEQQFPGDRLSPRQFRHHLASMTARLRVIEDASGQLLGYVLVLRHRQRPLARLYSIAVDVAARGFGLGARLLADAEQQARLAGACGLQLEVRADNEAAIALYRSRGYELFARRSAYYEDGAEALCLRRRWDSGPPRRA